MKLPYIVRVIIGGLTKGFISSKTVCHVCDVEDIGLDSKWLLEVKMRTYMK